MQLYIELRVYPEIIRTPPLAQFWIRRLYTPTITNATLRGQSAQRTKESRIQILFGPFYESLYVNPKESNGSTSGAGQINPGCSESSGWQDTKSGIAHLGTQP